MNRLPNYFKFCRMRHGLKQKQMGRLLGGKCLHHVSRLERGKQLPSLETIMTYEILFGIESADLMPQFREVLVKKLAIRVNSQRYLFRDKQSLARIEGRLKPLSNERELTQRKNAK